MPARVSLDGATWSMMPSQPKTLETGTPTGVELELKPTSVHTDEHHDAGHTTLNKIVNLVFVIVPFIGLLAAIVLVWGWGFSWVQLAVLGGMYLISGLGVTIGFHRYFAHKSFDTGPVVKTLLGVSGSMAAEGSIVRWVSFHRCHHQHSDHEEDPHSPHTHGAGVLNTLRGFWRAHVGWIFENQGPRSWRYAPDLMRDKLVRRLSLLFPLWVTVGLLIPTIIAGVVTLSWWGALLGFIWGGLVRILLVHHVTWSINSVCHLWGTRPFVSRDESRNNPVFGVLGLGEGWHNNHHAFPTSARHGLRWWEIDVSYLTILLMSKVGLVRNVRVPTPERMESRRRRNHN
ncbi:MAG: fatty acid desaturase [Phycisphaeraceae bacterium]|nr:fatty acid desaturase [Phycisphaeraceae bacterium]MCW5761757.1 fatty acid desaturase [Phycisphaeraceae bacterium]